jgi:hypothetical protein
MYKTVSVLCRGKLNGIACGEHIELPFPAMRKDLVDRTPELRDWPPQDWSAYVACGRCLQIGLFQYEDIRAEWFDVTWMGPDWIASDEQKFAKVELKCSHCKVPMVFYVDREQYPRKYFEGNVEVDYCVDPSQLSNADILLMTRTGQFSGRCPNGHELLAIPEHLYRVTKASIPLGSIADEVPWVRSARRDSNRRR